MPVKNAAFMGMALVLLVASGCSDDQSRSQIRELQARLDRVEQDRETGSSSDQQLRGEIIALRMQYQASQKQIEKLRQEIYSGAGQRGDPAHLIPYLNHSDKEVRRAAIRIVSRLRVKKAIPVLLEIAERDNDSVIRVTALDALEKLRPRELDDLLIQLLGDHDAQVASRAANVMGNLALPKFVKPLGEALRRMIKDGPAQVGRRRSPYRRAKTIVYALWRIGDPAAADYLLEALRSDDPHLVKDVSLYLPRFMSKAIAPKVARLIREKLQGESTPAKNLSLIAMLKILGNLRSSSGVPVVIEIINGHPDLRRQAESALTRLAQSGGYEPIAAAFQAGQTESGKKIASSTRLSLATALGATRDRRAVSVLLDALDDADPQLSARITGSLNQAFDPGQAKRLVAAWEKADGNRSLRSRLDRILRSRKYPVTWNAQTSTFTLNSNGPPAPTGKTTTPPKTPDENDLEKF